MSTADYVHRLLTLGWRHGELPIYGSPEWETLPLSDPRRFASVVRAAEAWRTEGTDQAIRDRIKTELTVLELASRWQISSIGRDVHDAYTHKEAS